MSQLDVSFISVYVIFVFVVIQGDCQVLRRGSEIEQWETCTSIDKSKAKKMDSKIMESRKTQIDGESRKYRRYEEKDLNAHGFNIGHLRYYLWGS